MITKMGHKTESMINTHEEDEGKSSFNKYTHGKSRCVTHVEHRTYTIPLRGLQYEYRLDGWPGKFQFSLHQFWVLGNMKVAWLLAAFIAIVTYIYSCSGAGYVPS